MRVGVLVVPTDPWDDAVSLVSRLETLGYHHVWTYDHLSWRRFHGRPWFGTYAWLAGMAAVTERIRLGTMVSNLNVRHPVALAQDAMTLDHVSHGRFTLGLGAGGLGYDASVLGQQPMTPGERVDRLAEATGLIDGLLRGEVHDHAGDHYDVNDACVAPGCLQRPRVPLAVAAGGTRSLRVAARFGDAWITYGDTTHHDTSDAGTERVVAEQVRQLEDHCAAIGRDPGEIDRIYLAGITDARPLADLAAFDEFVGRYAALGFTDVVFHMPRADDPVWADPPEMIEQIADAYLQHD